MKGKPFTLSASWIQLFCLSERMLTTRLMPPNILVRVDSTQTFLSQKVILDSVLQRNTYTIYQLDGEKFRSQAWLKNCSLLVYGMVQAMSSEETKMLDTYLKRYNGKILFNSVNPIHYSKLKFTKAYKHHPLNEDFPEMQCYRESEDNNLVVVVEKELNDISLPQLTLILKSLHVDVVPEEGNKKEDLNEEELTAYLFTSNIHQKLSDIFNKVDITSDGVYSVCGKKRTILFTMKPYEGTKKASEVLIVYMSNQYANQYANCQFKWLEYKKHLKTKFFGRYMIYSDVLPSTHNILTDLRVNIVKVNGLTVTARQQTCGKGRSDNDWLSPVGCMMFSIQIDIPLHSNLGQKLSYIQHIAVVAFVKSIKTRQGYSDINLSIKWPNDIYVNRKTKVGGVIVNSSFWGSNFKAVIGLGVNISNKRPTACLNDLIWEFNKSNGTNLPELTIEEVLAGTLNHMEELVNVFQGDDGVEKFQQEYYRYWMHSNAEVILESFSNETAIVVGIDDFGYLLVRLQDGSEVSYQPDGNRFDMMTNMITLKT